MKNNIIAIVCLLLSTSPLFVSAQSEKKSGEFYQITVYHFSNADQQKLIDTYLKDAYLPVMHRQAIKSVGVFTPFSNDTAADKKIYVVLPVKSLKQLTELAGKMDKDIEYLDKGKEFLDAVYNKPAFNRIENILLKAFPLAPFMTLPALKSSVAEKVYELRSYESTSQKIFENKVKMFNEGGEITLFKRLNFNAVFYASVIAGSKMPNLMYMTSFENMADRDAHWKSFGADPEWKKLSAMPEYQHNVSKNDIVFLRATPYSDY